MSVGLSSTEKAASLVVPGSANQDRAAVVESPCGVTLVVADGAGGVAGGAQAAQSVIDIVSYEAWRGVGQWHGLLSNMDHGFDNGGLTTAVIVQISGTSLVGASVGDSEAWLVHEQGATLLTEGQSRKPLLGSGNAQPYAFQAEWTEGDVLLMASDGLFKYTRRDDILAVLRAGGSPLDLVNLVRLPSGGLQDDVAVVLWRSASAEAETL